MFPFKQPLNLFLSTSRLSLIRSVTLPRINMSIFSSKDYSIDKYNGVNIDLDKVNLSMPHVLQDSNSFLIHLQGSLKYWYEKGYRAIWFHVKLANASLVPILVQNGFDYHHAKSGHVTLVKWIRDNEPNNIPSYPYTNIGVGGLVVNRKDEILVVKERYHLGHPLWKFPGGYANQGEDFGATAEREVLEETGIKARFESVIALRHSHRFQFKCSDIYFVCRLRPVDENDLTPVKDSHEISEVCWMPQRDLLPLLSPFNAFILKHYLTIRDQKAQLVCEKMDSLIGRVDVYFVDKNDSSS